MLGWSAITGRPRSLSRLFNAVRCPGLAVMMTRCGAVVPLATTSRSVASSRLRLVPPSRPPSSAAQEALRRDPLRRHRDRSHRQRQHEHVTNRSRHLDPR